MKPAKIVPNESVQSQTDASSVNATPFVPPETKIEWQEEPAPVVKQTAGPMVIRVESGGAAAAPAPIASAETVSAPADSPDSPHTLTGISSFDTEDTERDSRSLAYLSAAAGLLVAALLVLGLGVHLYNQRLEEAKAQAGQPQDAVVQKADAKPAVPQAAKAASEPQASAAQSPAATLQSNAAAGKPAVAKTAATGQSAAAAPAKPALVASAQAASTETRRSSVAKATVQRKHTANASLHLPAPSQQSKVRVVNGVKHYSDMD